MGISQMILKPITRMNMKIIGRLIDDERRMLQLYVYTVLYCKMTLLIDPNLQVINCVT